MDKIAEQQEVQEVTQSIINQNGIAMTFWKQALSDARTKVVMAIRAADQLNPNLQLNIFVPRAIGINVFQQLASNAEESFSLAQIASMMNAISNVEGIKSNEAAMNAINNYLSQYGRLVTWLENWKPNPQKNITEKRPIRHKSPQMANKIKQLQSLLGVPANGTWNNESNTAFLSWLKTNGWDKYISGNRFTGNIDEAIRALLVEKAASPAQESGASPDMQQRRAARLELLKKMGL